MVDELELSINVSHMYVWLKNEQIYVSFLGEIYMSECEMVETIRWKSVV